MQLWTPAYAGVTAFFTFYENIIYYKSSYEIHPNALRGGDE